MSHKLIGLNEDLRKLQSEGFALQVKAGYLIIHDIPYVRSNREIARGLFVSPLELAGDKTVKPGDHKMFFIGEHPCTHEGEILKGIVHASGKQDLGRGLVVDHSFSNKPTNGYDDYFHKVTTYTNILLAHAQVIDPSTSATRSMPVKVEDEACVHKYYDTNSSRADINTISEKLETQKIAIIGLGGTGSYVLDFVAKTWVKEIHIFDGDTFLSHNAFRSPGAAAFDLLLQQPKKVDYLTAIYSNVRHSVIPHGYYLDSSNVNELAGFDFVFVCVDKGPGKKIIVEKIQALGIPFVDVGMAIYAIDGSLTGTSRVTAVFPDKKDHVTQRVSFSEAGENDYEQNIQIAELNALNAALAVAKWKKHFRLFHDLQGEHHSVYELNINKIINDEIVTPIR